MGLGSSFLLNSFLKFSQVKIKWIVQEEKSCRVFFLQILLSRAAVLSLIFWPSADNSADYQFMIKNSRKNFYVFFVEENLNKICITIMQVSLTFALFFFFYFFSCLFIQNKFYETFEILLLTLTEEFYLYDCLFSIRCDRLFLLQTDKTKTINENKVYKCTIFLHVMENRNK